MTSSEQVRLQSGLRLHEQGRLAEAERIYRSILADNPRHSDSLHWLGVIAYQNGDLANAISLISRSLAIDPDFAHGHFNLGNAFFQDSRIEDALASFGKAVSLRPDYTNAYVNRGICLNNLGRFEEALSSFAKAIALNPDHVDAHVNRSVTLHDMKRFAQSVASCDRAIALCPDSAAAHYNRGIALKELRRFQEALSSYDRAVALDPKNADAHYNRGTVLCELHRFDEALLCFDQAIALKPDSAGADGNRGPFPPGKRHRDRASAASGQSIAGNPDHDYARHNRSLLNLLLGKYEEGWREYEYRPTLLDLSDDYLPPRPRLRSLEGINGKTVLVHAEQGLGDTIQFYRFIALLQDAGAKALFAPQPPLRALFAAQKTEAILVDRGDRSLPFDYHVPLMSLPLLFSTASETIPSKTPYLHADRDRVEKWQRKIGAGAFRIGICWQGSVGHHHDGGRSFPVLHFEEISRIPGVRLISLHKGEGEKQLKMLPDGMLIETLGADFDAGPAAFLDTAAVMMSLDLVITSDTAIAHLAGALGVPTWLVLPFLPDWRWSVKRTDSPWYPSMQVFRQPSAGDWQAVFRQVREALIARLLHATADDRRMAPG